MDYDTSWCPVCDRQILPKRFRVPKTPPPQQPSPAPPPSSPQSSPTKTTVNPPQHGQGVRRLSKGGTIRAKAGGLVRGTGRVNPNGALKRSDSTNSKSSQSSTTTAPPKPAPPIKYREVIDTSPLPLYCSDECQMADLHNTHGGLPLNYRPDRDQDSLPAVPKKSFRSADSDTSSGYNSSSLDSQSSLNSSSAAPTTKISPSLATLAAKYHFPPLPPPAPTFFEESSSDSDYATNEYTSGIMMAGRRLADMCPKPAKKLPYGPGNYGNDAPEHKIIPGWNDGSNAWRAEAYSLSSSKHTIDANGQYTPPKAYGSYIASSHRSSRGVFSTVGENKSSSSYATPNSLESERLQRQHSAETQELMSKYSLSFTRRSESRASLSSSAPSGSFRKPRPLVAPGAEGKILVTEGVMCGSRGSSSSLSSGWSGPSSSASRRMRSPLSGSDSNSSEDGDAASPEVVRSASAVATSSLPPAPKSRRRPAAEPRSWSYDHLPGKTYPVMPPVPRKEKRTVKEMGADGVEVEKIIEVEVYPEFKRLFNFDRS